MNDQHQQMFGLLVGKYVWGVENEFGTHLSLEFGDPRLAIREPVAIRGAVGEKVSKRLSSRSVKPVGSYRLLLMECIWELRLGDDVISMTDGGQRKDSALEFLDGQLVRSVRCSDDQEVNLDFDLETQLVIKAEANRLESERWIFTAGDINFSESPSGAGIIWET